MSTTENRSTEGDGTASSKETDPKVQVVVVPVSDGDHATDGSRHDAVSSSDNGLRIVQLSPSGSGTSSQNLYLIVQQERPVKRTRRHRRRPSVSEMSAFHSAAFRAHFHPDTTGYLGHSGDSHSSNASPAPDGNGWLLQKVTSRPNEGVDTAGTSFSSPNDLANAMRRAEAAHREHQKRTGEADPNWIDWYAEYMTAEQAGTELST